ncbi:MAG: GHKL domain-containing protein [Cryomorphaceae bacterium]|nr:GHKL domain-containing protein [Cryomorphaceae bacterium]
MRQKLKRSQYLGFNDTWLLLLGIPFVAIIIPPVFFGLNVSIKAEVYCDTLSRALFFTTLMWFGNREIMVRIRKKLPSAEDDKKRILAEFFGVMTFTLGVNIVTLLGLIFRPHEVPDFAIPGIYSSVFITLFVATIYETIWYTARWKAARLEATLLRKENLQSQLTVLRNQINPHFLFNSLNTLTAIIHEHPDKAVAFVRHMGNMYRKLLDVHETDLVTLQKEMELLNHYVFLLETRFEDKLNIHVEIDPDVLSSYVVPYSLQLTIENAIKHNIVSSKNPLQINISNQGENLIIANNLQRKKQEQESTGLGLKNIDSRYTIATGKRITVIEEDGLFKVTLPLIKIPNRAHNHR